MLKFNRTYFYTHRDLIPFLRVVLFEFPDQLYVAENYREQGYPMVKTSWS